jgi:murein DD-endopeptidase MepM/ murein hydrolase activator NlpD
LRFARFIPLLTLCLAALPARARSILAGRALAPDAPVAAQAETPACPHRSLAGRCLPRPRCPESELELDGICLPAQLDAPEDLAPGLATNSHVDRSGRLVVYEHLPRRPDLPADYDRYEYPVAPWRGRTVRSGYDLGLPDALQRRGAELSAVGHGGVDLPHERGAPVRAMALRGQVGDPEVLYAGQLFGTTVVLRHVVREGATLRSYVALHGHLEAAAPGLVRGQTVVPGTVIGFVGDSGSLGMVHLHYETRLVRPGVDPMRVEPTEVHRQEVSVPCDPRNLLPLRTEPIAAP